MLRANVIIPHPKSATELRIKTSAWRKGNDFSSATAAVITASATTGADINGIGHLTAAIIVGRVGDIGWFPTAGTFARHNGAAPRSKRHRDRRNGTVSTRAVTAN
jgi:transposase